ncbi:MAG: hypothetical protein D6681_18050 [Calditrichaeota bacterium]|nr:MAG: hypothetical protein D6681_18050 [Calditrichota bacterium]
MQTENTFTFQAHKGLAALLLAALLITGRAFSARGAGNALSTSANTVWVHYGPEGGNVFSLLPMPSNPQVLYAGTRGGGIFKSMDGGASWFPVNNGIPIRDRWDTVYSLVAHPTDSQILYAGTGSGVFKSTDGGIHWDSTGLTDSVYALAMDPADPSVLYAGAYDGMYKTTDGGNTWEVHNNGLTDIWVQSMSIASGGVYAGTSSGLFRSTDGGNTWNPVGSIPNTLRVSCIVVAPTNSSIMYLGGYTYTYPSDGVLYKSTDGGVTWSRADSGISNTSVSAIAIDPATTTTLYAGVWDEIYKSTDGGASWSAINTGSTGDITALAIAPHDSSVIYAGLNAGGDAILKSTDSGATWSASNHGIVATSISGLAVDPLQPDTIYATMYGGGIFKSVDAGIHWTHLDTSGISANVETSYISALALDPVNPTTIYAGSSMGSMQDGVFKSTDGGAHWYTTGLGGGWDNVSVLSLLVDPMSPNVVYAGTRGQGIYKSTDGGNSWYSVNTGILYSSYTSVDLLVIDPANSAVLYAVMYDYSDTYEGVYKTTDGGSHWNKLGGGVPNSVSTLVIHPHTSSMLYAGTYGNGIYQSSDGGAHWVQMNTTLPTSRVLALVIPPSDPGSMYAATDAGVFVSSDGGVQWTSLSSGLPAGDIYHLAVAPTDAAKIYAGSSAGGVFIRQPVPQLAVNYDTGAPGSFFTVSGSNFPAGQYATVMLNGQVLTNTLAIDTSGNFTLILDTQSADTGFYLVSASTNLGRTVQFTLDSTAPLRAQEGSGLMLDVPAGVAFTNQVFLPVMVK